MNGTLTKNTTLLLLIQHPLRINPSFEITLRDLAQLVIFQGNLAHELEILLEPFRPTLAIIKVIIKLHARIADLFAGTHTETAHPTAVQVQRADGIEEQEEAVVWIRWVSDVPAVGVVVVHLVKRRRVFHAKRPMSVLAVQTLLVPVDHGLPVEAAGVFDGAAVRKAAEVVAREQFEKRCREPLRERRGGGVDGGEK